jgi:hypothetical protein
MPAMSAEHEELVAMTTEKKRRAY